jgi:drug/metabolite transporter (DMT)-like permease
VVRAGVTSVTHGKSVICYIWPLVCNSRGMNRTLGVILIVIGLIGVVWGGFSYTTSKKVIDLGPIQATRTQTHHVPVAPLAGAALLVGGAVLLATGKR